VVKWFVSEQSTAHAMNQGLKKKARLLAVSAFLESHLQRQPSSTVWNAL
jgi:hypothetical protein